MKVLLIMPPAPPGLTYPSAVHPRFFPPLGIGYIAAIIEKKGYKVRIADLYLQKWETAFPVLKGEQYDIIGITSIFPSRTGVHSLIKLAAALQPKAKIVLGGPFATVMAERLAALPQVAAVVVGEAEVTAPELFDAIRDGRPLSGVKGIVYSEGGQVIKTGPRGFIEDLDSLPFPAFHLYDLKSYLRFQPGNFNPVSQFLRDLVSGRRWAPVLTTRSCDFKCQFCAVQITCGSKARSRSGRNVADEFERLHRVYGYRDIFLQDAAFPVGSELSNSLCAELLKRGLRINWATNARADMVTRDSLRMLKAAGCSYLLYGMESGSPGILRNIHKQETLEQIIEAIVLSREAGINVGVHILVGYPGENEETIAETIRVIKKIRRHIHTLYVRPLMVFPGTALYRKVIADGQLGEEDFFRPSRRFFIPYTKERSWETLSGWTQRIQSAVKPFDFLKRISMAAARLARLSQRSRHNG
jgi:radical SAM superfamily enzyme YgiQ (UPF0313 family)